MASGEGEEGGAAEKLAKPRLVTDVDANCGFLITPPLPTVFSIFQLCTLGLPAHGPKLYVHVCEIVKLKGKTLGLQVHQFYSLTYSETDLNNIESSLSNSQTSIDTSLNF